MKWWAPARARRVRAASRWRWAPSAAHAPRHPPAEVDPELLFATNGISGTLGLLCSLFVSRGDVIVVEEPSYFLALSIFRDFGLTIVPVGLDEDGLKTEELEAKLAGGLRPAVVYTIPAFHNPTAVCLSADRKKHLVALARKYDFQVWADEVYQLLGFTGALGTAEGTCEGGGDMRCSGCCCCEAMAGGVPRQTRSPHARTHHPHPRSCFAVCAAVQASPRRLPRCATTMPRRGAGRARAASSPWEASRRFWRPPCEWGQQWPRPVGACVASALCAPAGRRLAADDHHWCWAPRPDGAYRRLGWFQVAPCAKHLLARVYGCGQLDSSGGVNPVISGVVQRFIQDGHQKEHLAVSGGQHHDTSFWPSAAGLP